MQANFISQGNLRMLWDVIMDNEEIQKNKAAAAKLFNQTTPNFFTQNEDAQKATNLTELNKAFLFFMTKQLTESSKKELVTSKEIQKEKQDLFQKDLEQKQKEFENFMAKPVPESLDFSDNINEQPISEMEAMIKKTLEERNFEIQQIHKSQQPVDDSWLKSEQTSVKEEKLQKMQPVEKKPSSNILSKLKPERKTTANEIASIHARLDGLENILLEIRETLKNK
jgi:hypothetical protein